MNNEIAMLMPIKAAPYDHQIKAFEFAADKFGIYTNHIVSHGVALLMEMGTGKTLASIAIAGALYQAGKIKRILIVAPLSILGVWEEEFEKFADFPYSWSYLRVHRQRRRSSLRTYRIRSFRSLS